jgi:hypothetical protein
MRMIATLAIATKSAATFSVGSACTMVVSFGTIAPGSGRAK